MKNERLKSVIALIALFLTFLVACNKDEIVDLFLQQTSSELSFPSEGGEKGFAITTNGGAWTVSAPDADWITFDVTSGEGKGSRESVLVTIDRNRGDAREGKILIQAGEQQSEITVNQEDGRIIFEEATLEVESFLLGQSLENTYLTFPYQQGVVGDELKFSVELAGDATDGIDPVIDFSVVLEEPAGEISIPLSGTPTSVGEVVLTITLTDNTHGIITPESISIEVFDPNTPHPDALPFVISGWLPQAADGDVTSSGTQAHEYMQLLALRDIDFSEEHFSVFTCNNAGQTNGIPPADGWATGGARTHKFNITSGQVSKGEYFYIGGNSKKVNGQNSINTIPDDKWVVSRNYSQIPGDDGVGNTLTNLFANSGLTYGIAIFKGTNVNHDTEPLDVVFLRSPETSYTLFGEVNGESRGFRVTNTDYYTTTDVIKYINQYDTGGTYYNVSSIGGAGASVSNPGAGNFVELRGVYDIVTATWTTVRSRNLISLSASSTVADIETGSATKMTPAP